MCTEKKRKEREWEKKKKNMHACTTYKNSGVCVSSISVTHSLTQTDMLASTHTYIYVYIHTCTYSLSFSFLCIYTNCSYILAYLRTYIQQIMIKESICTIQSLHIIA